MPRQLQEIRGFTGVNLRKDRLLLDDQEMAKAINADFHSQPGTLVLRPGRAAQYTTALAQPVIRKLARHNGFRYRVAGSTVYRDSTEIMGATAGNPVNAQRPVDFEAFRPLNDTTLWTFIANPNGMFKDNGTVLRKWGIAAPGSAPVVAAGTGTLTGTYSARYTYVRKDGVSLAHESNPSPVSASVVLAAQGLAVTVLASADAQVTHIRLYRNVTGGSSYLFDQDVTNTSQTVTSTQADNALGAAVETDNDVPPNLSRIAEFQSTIFGVGDLSNPHYLWYSKRFRPESWPTDNFIEIGNPDDPLQEISPLAGLLGVFSRRTKYRVTGNDTSGFTAFEALSKRGLPGCADAAVPTEQGVVFVARDGVYLTNFISQDQELSEKIAPLFDPVGDDVNGLEPINWDVIHTSHIASWKNRVYVALPLGNTTVPTHVAVFSRTTQQWTLYDHAARSLLVEEDVDQLVAGFTDGIVYILEMGHTDGTAEIALDAETGDSAGQQPGLRKLFLWSKVDAEIPTGETLSVDMYADGVLRRTASVTGNRTKLLLPWPEASMGYAWRLGFRYTGCGRPKIHGRSCLWEALAPA